MAVHDLRESANSRTSKLQQEMSTMQDSTSSIKTNWSVHMEKTESNYLKDTSAVESGRKDLEEVLRNWYWATFKIILVCCGIVYLFLFILLNLFQSNLISLNEAQMGALQWKSAQESLLSLEKSNVASVDAIVRYANSTSIILAFCSSLTTYFSLFI